MITAAQLRAARGLLDWTRSELAKASGLSAETIKNIEHGVYMPQDSTINAIVKTFGDYDIEFIDNEGVRTKKNRVRLFSGKAGYLEFLDHIFSTLKDNGGIIRQFNISDGTHLSYADDYAEAYVRKVSKIANLDARVLTNAGDYNFPAPYCVYRWIKGDSDRHIPYYIYNDNVCFVIHRNATGFEVVSINSKLLADKFIEQFEDFWKESIFPPEKEIKKC